MTAQGPGDSSQSSRTRLLNAGKALFAKNGYEQTSTAAIARESGSSESQLIRYFGGKAGLLEAVFNESWTPLLQVAQERVRNAKHGRDAILALLVLMMQTFGRDIDIALLFLFEGRRIRGHTHEVVLSKGFVQFMQVIDEQIRRGQEDGSFRADVQPNVLSSAMLGAAEGMVRDRLLSVRNRQNASSGDDELVRTFTAMVDGLAPAS